MTSYPIHVTESLSCMSNLNASEARDDAFSLLALMSKINDLQVLAGPDCPLSRDAQRGLQLVSALAKDKVRAATEPDFFPCVERAGTDAPSLAELLQAGARAQAARKALTAGIERVEGLAEILEDMAFDASMYLRNDDDFLAGALQTRAKALREAVKAMRTALAGADEAARG